jgi:hypothetical protein
MLPEKAQALSSVEHADKACFESSPCKKRLAWGHAAIYLAVAVETNGNEW